MKTAEQEVKKKRNERASMKGAKRKKTRMSRIRGGDKRDQGQ